MDIAVLNLQLSWQPTDDKFVKIIPLLMVDMQAIFDIFCDH